MEVAAPLDQGRVEGEGGPIVLVEGLPQLEQALDPEDGLGLGVGAVQLDIPQRPFGLRQRPTNPGDRKVLNKLLLGKFVTVQKQYIARIRAGIHNLNVARSRTARLEPTSKD